MFGGPIRSNFLWIWEDYIEISVESKSTLETPGSGC